VKPVEYIVVGAGSRGSMYARYAIAHPAEARVVGVAEPRAFFRERLVAQHGISAEHVAEDWRALAQLPKFADAVVIATQDAQHLEPAVAFAEAGYDLLLEKPLAPDPVSCQRIVDAVEANNAIFAVAHVLRYTAYTQQLKALLDAGTIGQIVSVNHVEPLGYWHQAHSFVRGNWRKEATSSFMLLAKSCHDIDWLRYVIGEPCVRVSSFGSLLHFRKEAKPGAAGAATRCLDCAYEPQCPYSAKKLYLGLLRRNQLGWPLDVIATDFSEEGVTAALRDGPYGRCVYECDNDVVDHQVVNLEYASGVTASFTMISTSEYRDRQTTIFGTRGELRGNGDTITHVDFVTDATTTIPVEVPQPDASTAGQGGSLSGHGGGDYGLMRSFVAAVAQRDPTLILSGPRESLETHLTVFAAEQARREQRVVQVPA
jgi:predicted dehydrogenase